MAMAAVNFERLIDEDLPMQVDCVQWCPKLDVLCVGAYQLCNTNTDVRIGRIYLLQLKPEVPGGFAVVHEEETKGGVLDFKFFSSADGTDYIAIATSEGMYIHVLTCTPTPSLELLQGIDTNVMSLYVQWINERSILFSDAEGNLNMIEKEGLNYQITKKKKLHDALSWICHYSQVQDMIYCGCDDGKFTAFQTQDMLRDDEAHFVHKYNVGVTSVCTSDNTVAVGGYDDVLKLYEVIKAGHSKPVLQFKAQINLGGAVWRSMFIPNICANGSKGKYMIATACARNGVKILEYDVIQRKVYVMYERSKYEGALAYGLDVKIDEDGSRYLIASGYFDNHVVDVFALSLH